MRPSPSTRLVRLGSQRPAVLCRSVREFATKWESEKRDLHILINNAGIYAMTGEAGPGGQGARGRPSSSSSRSRSDGTTATTACAMHAKGHSQGQSEHQVKCTHQQHTST